VVGRREVNCSLDVIEVGDVMPNGSRPGEESGRSSEGEGYFGVGVRNCSWRFEGEIL
jgi:hypothetical protein